MSLFSLRQWFKQILAWFQGNKKEATIVIANLTAAVDAAVSLINAQGAEIVSLKAQLAAVVDDSAAEQAEADKLTAAIAANPV